MQLNINPFTYSREGGKRLNDLKYGIFIGSFPSDMAVKGLIGSSVKAVKQGQVAGPHEQAQALSIGLYSYTSTYPLTRKGLWAPPLLMLSGQALSVSDSGCLRVFRMESVIQSTLS